MDSSDILTEDRNRFVLYPIRHSDIFDLYTKAKSSFWTPEELDFSLDTQDWETRLTPNERFFLEQILAFFAASDGIVGENLMLRFYNDVKCPEAKAFYAFQLAMETIHSETYSLLIETLVKSPQRKAELFDAIHTIPCVEQKAQWAQKWIDSPDAPFAQRLVAFIIIEGLFFSGAFCAIFWMAERGLLPTLCMSNAWISRDEALHTEFGILLFSKLAPHQLPPPDVIREMFREAVEIESSFITQSIPCGMLGMNADLMTNYIQYVADRLLQQLSFDKLFNTPLPFDFMHRLALSEKVNFFERRSTQYSKANVGTESNFEFSTTSDF